MSTYTVPARFWDDHASTNDAAGDELKRTARTVTVDLTPRQLRDLIDDADLYATGADDFWEEYRGLVLSARATLKALRAQGVEWRMTASGPTIERTGQ